MFKNLKIGLKMGMGFAVVILLVGVIGGISILNMVRISGLADRLQGAYIPEVRIANEVERFSLQTINSFQSYSLDFGADEYSAGMESFTKVEEALAAAEELSQSHDYLKALAANVGTAVDSAGRFIETVGHMHEGIGQVEAARQDMDGAAAVFVDSINEYLAGQDEKLTGQINTGAQAAALRERAWKIRRMNDVLDIGNGARILNFKAQALDDYDLMEQALDSLGDIDPIIADIREVTTSDDDHQLLDRLMAAKERYGSSISTAHDVFMEIDQERSDMNAEGAKVLEAAERTSVAGIAAAQDIANQTVHMVGTAITLVLTGLAAALVFAVVIAFVLTSSIVKALAKGVGFAGEIALGNLSAELDVVQKDELGILADALRSMQRALQEKGRVLERIADGDLTVEFKKASDKDDLGESLLVMKSSLTEILGGVKEAVEQVANGADQVSQASQSLSQGATEQASSLEEISSSINEVNSQARQNAENAVEANGLAKSANSSALEGDRQMEELRKAMLAINSSSDQIKKVVKVIDDIAFQINLLALNANVEAARAGKYGKGFAVVAEEVRNLAVKSATAVQETTGMVEESIRNIELGNRSVEGTAVKLREIVEGAGRVATFLEEIAEASREQAQAIDQITEGLDQIDQVTQSNTASAEESASASEELAGQADQLKGLVARFTLADTERLLLSDGRR